MTTRSLSIAGAAKAPPNEQPAVNTAPATGVAAADNAGKWEFVIGALTGFAGKGAELTMKAFGVTSKTALIGGTVMTEAGTMTTAPVEVDDHTRKTNYAIQNFGTPYKPIVYPEGHPNYDEFENGQESAKQYLTRIKAMGTK